MSRTFREVPHYMPDVNFLANRGMTSQDWQFYARRGLVPLFNVCDDAGIYYTGRKQRKFVKKHDHRRQRFAGKHLVEREVLNARDEAVLDAKELAELDSYYEEMDLAYEERFFMDDDYDDTCFEPDPVDDYDPFYDSFYDPYYDY